MDITQRIAQFEQMAREDPTNEMVHYSLGGAYAQADRWSEAATSYQRCVELVPDMSKAHQLAGEALMKAGQPERAGEVLEEGYRVAASRGDQMPRQAIAAMLTELGRPLPDAQPAAAAEPAQAGEGSFTCRRTGRPGTQMPRPPFRGPVGQWIQDNVSKETFHEWIGLGTKIINELRLDLSRDEHDAVYDYAMRRYIGLTDEKYEALAGKAPPQPTPEYREVIDSVLARAGQLEEFQGELHKGMN